MTVRFRKYWNGRFISTVETFDKETERQLIAKEFAIDVHDRALLPAYNPAASVPAEQAAYAAKVLADAEAHKASLG